MRQRCEYLRECRATEKFLQAAQSLTLPLTLALSLSVAPILSLALT